MASAQPPNRVSSPGFANVTIKTVQTENEGLKRERLTVDVDGGAVDAQLEHLAAQNKRWEDAAKKHAAAKGDVVVVDFAGSVGGKPFEGGTGEDMQIELGSGRLIPGFEDQ